MQRLPFFIHNLWRNNFFSCIYTIFSSCFFCYVFQIEFLELCGFGMLLSLSLPWQQPIDHCVRLPQRARWVDGEGERKCVHVGAEWRIIQDSVKENMYEQKRWRVSPGKGFPAVRVAVVPRRHSAKCWDRASAPFPAFSLTASRGQQCAEASERKDSC